MRVRGRNAEGRYAHESAEEIKHKDDEPSGEWDHANLRSSGAADLAQEVVQLVTHRRCKSAHETNTVRRTGT
jgi:hypothetical protein